MTYYESVSLNSILNINLHHFNIYIKINTNIFEKLLMKKLLPDIGSQLADCEYGMGSFSRYFL